MELSCEIKVKEVLIGKENLSGLFQQLEEIATEVGDINERDKIYTLHFDNGIKITGSDFKIFENYPKQGKSRPIKIEATITSRYEDFKSAASIYCDIEHGNRKWGQRFIISSNDSSNFEHTRSVITNSIESFEPQKQWAKSKMVWGLAKLVLNAVLLFISMNLIKYLAGTYTLRVEGVNLSAEALKGNFDINLIFVFLAIQWLPVSILIEKLENLAKENWPSIELNIGESWQRKEAKRRSFFAYVFAVFIFPILLFVLSI